MDIDGTSYDFWELTCLFFQAMGQFDSLSMEYDSKVQAFARERGVDRKDLKLTAEEVSGLFDFKSLERLRNDCLWKIKEISHRLFRAEDSTDTFDRYVSEVFHEISILKEEHYTVKTYAPINNGFSRIILEEVHHFFPLRLEKVGILFSKAKSRLEGLFALNRQNRIFIRSLYLYSDGLLDGIYVRGISDIYSVMYPDFGPREGYFQVGLSFFQSGFWARARTAFEAAKSSPAAHKADPAHRMAEIDEYLKQTRIRSKV